MPLPPASIQVQDPAGLLRELGIARVEPTPILPGFEEVAVQDPPDGAVTHHGRVGMVLHQAGQVGGAVPAQWFVMLRRQFAGQRFDRGDLQRGKKWACAHGPAYRSGGSLPWPRSAASSVPSSHVCPGACRRSHCRGRGAHATAAPAWRGRPGLAGQCVGAPTAGTGQAAHRRRWVDRSGLDQASGSSTVDGAPAPGVRPLTLPVRHQPYKRL